MRTIEVIPNAENATAEELLVAMEAAPNKRSYIRLAAIRSLLLGMDRKAVCKVFGRSDRMVRLWIVSFNEGGIDALITRPRSGRPRKVKLQKVDDLLRPVLEDPSLAGQTHWTGVKLHGYLREAVGVDISYSTTLRYLHGLNDVLRVPRRFPLEADETLRQTFLQDLASLRADPQVEIWFADECGVEGDPRPRHRWVPRGTAPKVGYKGTHLRSSVVGAVCPDTGESFFMIFDGVDTDVFAFWLSEFEKTSPKAPGKRRILVLDNASWHKSKSIDWRGFEPMFLPPYSPDLNPIERLWLRLKTDFFSDFIAENREHLNERLCLGLNHFMNQPDLVASNCSFRK